MVCSYKTNCCGEEDKDSTKKRKRKEKEKKKKKREGKTEEEEYPINKKKTKKIIAQDAQKNR